MNSRDEIQKLKKEINNHLLQISDTVGLLSDVLPAISA
jgi:hypothetical protein